MKEEKKAMPSNMTNINFDLIRGWISEHLKTPNDIVRSEGRNVLVNIEGGLKKITIPKLTENNKDDWKNSWLDVYEACLNALQLKVNRIYIAGKKEGYIIQTSPNEVRVGVSIIKISDDHNSVAYARALEKIIQTYNKLKEEEARRVTASPINVNHSTIKIDNPNKPAVNMYTIKTDTIQRPAKPTETKPLTQAKLNASATVTKPNSNVDENRVKTVRMTMPRPIEKPKETAEESSSSHQVIIQKVPGNVALDKADCEAYRDQPLVIVTCMSVKNGDGVFRDNIEMLRDNIPSIEVGSFISGKSTNIDQATKESTRILRLLADCKVSKLVIYEINNDYISNHLRKKENIISIINATNKICEDLISENYYPILCMDFDTYENIKKTVQEFKEKYPIIKCVTPKQKDMVSNKDNILYMNPSSDSDAVMVSDKNMQTDLKAIPNTAVRESLNAQPA